MFLPISTCLSPTFRVQNKLLIALILRWHWQLVSHFLLDYFSQHLGEYLSVLSALESLNIAILKAMDKTKEVSLVLCEYAWIQASIDHRLKNAEWRQVVFQTYTRPDTHTHKHLSLLHCKDIRPDCAFWEPPFWWLYSKFLILKEGFGIVCVHLRWDVWDIMC